MLSHGTLCNRVVEYKVLFFILLLYPERIIYVFIFAFCLLHFYVKPK